MRDPIRRLRTDIPLGWVLFDALLEVCWLADGHAGKPQHFAHLSKELGMRIVVPPAPAITKLDEILLPTLDQSEPSASDTVVRTLLPFRHQGSQTAVESALADNQRALLIRATKMNAARPADYLLTFCLLVTAIRQRPIFVCRGIQPLKNMIQITV